MSRLCSSLRPSVLVVAVFAGVLIGWLWLRERTLANYDREVTAELAAQHRRITTHQSRNRTAVTAVTVDHAAPKARATRTQSAPESEAAQMAWLMKAQEQMPEYLEWRQAERQRSMMRFYGEWFSQLNIPPARMAELKALLTAEFVERGKVVASLKASGLDLEDPKNATQLDQIGQELMARVERAMTPEEFASYRPYELSYVWTATRLPDFQLYLAERGLPPLSSEQRAAVTRAAAEAREWKPPADLPQSAGERLRNERIATAAGNFIEGPQKDAFVAYIQYLNEDSRIYQQLLKPAASK